MKDDIDFITKLCGQNDLLPEEIQKIIKEYSEKTMQTATFRRDVISEFCEARRRLEENLKDMEKEREELDKRIREVRILLGDKTTPRPAVDDGHSFYN